MTEKLDFEEATSSMIRLDTVKVLFMTLYTMGLKCLMGDINSAYIQAYTKEKIYTIAGPEFGPLQGRILIIDQALYGLQGSGNAWHKKFADDLYHLRYIPSRAVLTCGSKTVEITMNTLEYL